MAAKKGARSVKVSLPPPPRPPARGRIEVVPGPRGQPRLSGTNQTPVRFVPTAPSSRLRPPDAQAAVTAHEQFFDQLAVSGGGRAGPGRLKGSKAAGPQPNTRAIANANANARFKRGTASPTPMSATRPTKLPAPPRPRNQVGAKAQGGADDRAGRVTSSSRDLAAVALRARRDRLLMDQDDFDRLSAKLLGGSVGATVDAHAELAQKIADVGRYALPGSERQFLEAIGRAFEGAIPGRIRKPPADSREAIEEEKAFRRRFEQTGSTRPPYHLTAAEFQRLSPQQRQRMQRLSGIRIMR